MDFARLVIGDRVSFSARVGPGAAFLIGGGGSLFFGGSTLSVFFTGSDLFGSSVVASIASIKDVCRGETAGGRVSNLIGGGAFTSERSAIVLISAESETAVASL